MKTFERFAILFVLPALFLSAAAALPQNTDPPSEVVKLIFIHHSTGENWLSDGYGDLGKTLGENNYFVSDTNYGWGPGSIGDRTDIPNWIEWFSSANTPIYMEALFNETEQRASYTRTLTNPGGENQVVMFKSCFPNSALEGSPNDPPGAYEELSVSGAKYVYNTILNYFGSRPDKLFIVITAPPLSDPAYAENARAFNNWLVNDWLRENNYPYNNVAVFDFYNILTDPNAHHWVNQGQIEHITTARNTLYYPSGDDHPSEKGSRKATAEFVPMLNAFYHRWKAAAPSESAPKAETAPQPESQPQTLSPSAERVVVDDFDSGAVSLSYGWEAYRDESTPSVMACGAAEGGRSGNALKINFDIAVGSWGTCALMYETPQNWSAAGGISFYFRASSKGAFFDTALYAGDIERRETYLHTIETSAESVSEWVGVSLRWEDFQRASWEDNAGAIFDKANQITGLAFGISAPPEESVAGSIQIDDLTLGYTEAEPSETQPLQETEFEEAKKPFLPCASALLVPLFLAAIPLLRRQKRQPPIF